MTNTCLSGCLATRVVVGIMILTSCFVSYMLRVNMSINIIAMVEPTISSDDSLKIQTGECLDVGINATATNETESLSKLTALPDYGKRYQWNPKIQGLILGSYFWGYILTSIPGGFLAERFGPTKTAAVSGFISSVFTLLIPLAASWSYVAVIIFRFMIGFVSGVLYPSLHCMVSRWAPPEEKGLFTSALLGGTLGTVVTWPLLGSIIEAWGWQWGFFVPGILSIVWCFLWILLVSDSPDVHSYITENEKAYITKSIGTSITKTKALPPYLKMFSSVPFWALNILHFGNLWGLNFLLTAGPKFMSEVLGFNLGHSGALAAVPYLTRMLAGLMFGFIGDTIRRKKLMSTTSIRKWFILVSHILPGCFLFSMIWVGCDAILSVVLITISLGLNGASTITNLQNNQDLAPNFAGTIYGIINCFGGMSGFFAPMLTGYLTSESNNLSQWHIIFSIGAIIYVASGIIFCIFGSGNQQAWNQITILKEEVGGVENPAFEPQKECNTSSNCKNSESTRI